MLCSWYDKIVKCYTISVSVLLVTIPETQTIAAGDFKSYIRGSGTSRNVHFSGVPPQPPSSPTGILDLHFHIINCDNYVSNVHFC